MLCSTGRHSARGMNQHNISENGKGWLTSWLTMSPVKMVKLMSSILKNDGIDLKEDNARSGGESQ